MEFKINEKIICIPPYLSASWLHIAILQAEGQTLIVHLSNGTRLEIKNLSQEILDQAFYYHSQFLEQENKKIPDHFLKEFLHSNEPAIKMSFGPFNGLNGAMQHDPSQADSPDLPAELLKKIGGITKIFFKDEQSVFSHSESGCNCFHCQISRAVQGVEAKIEEPEVVTEEDLQFPEWTITQAGSQLFTVSHRLEPHEKYNVFLGDPVGCTCGKQGCEHILAVLKS
ncbi:MAG: hypothetical protein LW832_02635 [Parachlamydia sp.]|jgi:hypothetical protein|nr:hypothetical protein [Parachlamydia sp.]